LSNDLVAEILAVLNSERFCDQAPAQVWATLLDEGRYLASVSTMYRILRAQHQVRERRRQARHPAHVKPELVADGPNQVWSWDITRLAGPHKWNWFQLYVILDVYSRYAVGWLVAPRESDRLAKELIAACAAAEQIPAGQLTLHADRGSSMTSRSSPTCISWCSRYSCSLSGSSGCCAIRCSAASSPASASTNIACARWASRPFATSWPVSLLPG